MTINKINVNGTEYDLDVLVDGSSISTAVSNTATVALGAYRGKVFAGSTSTGASTAAKAVTVDDTLWNLQAGDLLLLTSTNTNSAASATFAVNGGAAKTVKYGGASIAAPNLDKAGSSSAPQLYVYDGTNWVWLSGTSISASRLNNTAKVGDTNKPVYFTADGVPAAISYTISKSVPSNAVFTDTDTKVTSAANHYTPAKNNDSTKSASGATGTAGTTVQVVTGIEMDAKGHVTGVVSGAATDTDTKVTSAANHYTPSADNSAALTATLSGDAGTYALNTEYTVLTGVNAQRDAKGHVTGLTYTAQKIKDTNTTYSAGTTAQLTTGTDTSNRVWPAKQIADYVKSMITNATHYKGGFNANSTDGTIGSGSDTLKSVANAVGDVYTVTTAGTFLGTALQVGDSIMFKNAVAAGTAPVATDVAIVQGTVNVVNGSDTLAWGTDVTVGTVEGVAITAKLPSNPNTDTKVTSVGNHYAPSADTNSELTATIDGTAGTYALNTEYTVLTGVKAQRDAKGHVTGITYTAQKIKDTNNTYTVGNKALKVASNSGTATQAITMNESSADRTLTVSGDGTYITGAVSGSSNAATVTLSHANPTADANSELTASLSGTAGTYALNTEYTVLTGVKAQRDAKGHVTGLTYTAQKVKDTNNTYTGYNIAFQNNAGTTVDTYKALTSPSKTLKAGTNVNMSASSNVITISATDTTYSNATTSAAGLMSSTDKTKLDNITMSVTNNVLYLTTQATS